MDRTDFSKGADWIFQPKLSVTKDVTVTLDARKTKPVDITVPDTAAKSQFASADVQFETEQSGYGFGWWLDSFKGSAPRIWARR